MPKITLFERRVLVPAALALFYGLIICCVSIYLALHCAERKLPYASQFFCVTAFGVLVARFTTGRIYDRYGPNRVILPGILILTLSLLMIYEAETRGLLCCTGFLYGLSSGALFPAFQALTLSFAPGYLRTEATASFYNAFDVGVGCGTLVMGQVAGYFESYSAIYLAGGLIGVALFIYYVSFFVARRRDRA